MSTEISNTTSNQNTNSVPKTIIFFQNTFTNLAFAEVGRVDFSLPIQQCLFQIHKQKQLSVTSALLGCVR